MALKKTYGEIKIDWENDKIEIASCEPHVSIKLKQIFTKIPTYAVPPYRFNNTLENATDLLWVMQRYPMKVSKDDLRDLERSSRVRQHNINAIERIMMPNYSAAPVCIKEPHSPRSYQLQAHEMHMKVKRLLLGDDMGLGKTITSILSFLKPGTLPAIVAVQTHMPRQWKEDQIEKFTDLNVHIIQGTKPYNLPPADVYVIKYSCLAGWVDIYTTGFFKSAVMDEIQELRGAESKRHNAGKVLSANVKYFIGLSGTPIYNFGDEIWNILNLISQGCLGRRDDFLREWAVSDGNHWKIKDPQALGTYLRDNHLMLRRTRSDVGQELPPVNKIIHTVDYDQNEVDKSYDLAHALAMKITTGGFTESGQAARELDMLARQVTGVSKAKYVAELVRLILESGEPVLLSGWHRAVYDIWMEQLADFNPVLYTGSESGKQKEDAVRKFISGESKLFIMSNRSGAGLDGLQYSGCCTVVVGELDWSPKVLDQLIARVDRPGNPKQTTVFYPVSEYGSDPPMLNWIGLKASQSHGIMDPLQAPGAQHTDESRIKILAEQYLTKHKKAD